jgi:hypothetical protein
MEGEGVIPKDVSREIEQFSVGGWVRIFDYALGSKHFGWKLQTFRAI